MSRSIRTKILIFIVPFIFLTLLFLLLPLISYLAIHKAVKDVRGNAKLAILSGKFFLAFQDQLNENLNFALIGKKRKEDSEKRLEDILIQWKQQVLEKGEEQEELQTLEDLSKNYKRFLSYEKEAVELISGGKKSQATKILKDEMEQIDALIFSNVVLSYMGKEKEVSSSLSRLLGFMSRLIFIPQGTLQSNISSLKSNLSQAMLAAEFTISIKRQIKELSDLLLDFKTKDEDQFLESGLKARQSFALWKEEISQKKQADIQPLELTAQDYIRLLEEMEKSIQLRQAGKLEESLAVKEKKITPLFENEILARIEILTGWNEKEIDSSLETLSESVSKMGFVLGGSSLLVLIVGLTAPVFLWRKIVIPIVELRKAAAHIGDGKMETQVTIHSTDELGELAISFNQMVKELKAKLELLPFVSELVWKMAHKKASGDQSRCGEAKIVTILFCDLAGFTTFSDSKLPAEVVSFLNRFCEATSTTIRKEGGVVDKFIGDACMAIFDFGQDAGASAAVRSGAAIIRWMKEDPEVRKSGLGIRIGINTGTVILGEVGSGGRRDYTVIGSEVNKAQRLESAAEVGSIYISRETFKRLNQSLSEFQWEPLPPIKVKGIQEEIAVYRIRV